MYTEKFVARTRKRGEIDYYPAKWMRKKDGSYDVEFLNGPHKGETYQAIDVAIANKQWR